MKLSAIIPALDEARLIAGSVADLVRRRDIDEVIVVDGGSSDATAELAEAAGARVISCARGRGHQQNAGAAMASGDALVFVHADVSLPEAAGQIIRRQLAKRDVAGGAFRTWHRPSARAARWMGARELLLHLADVRSRYSPLPYGDQAVHVRADVFAAVGGFPEIPLMEDLGFARALRRLGAIAIAAESVSVSGRRFESAALYQTALVNVFPLLYYAGVPPRVLARLYGNPR